MADAMLDLETLGVTNNAVILTVGCVKFDPFNTDEPHSPLYFAIDINEQQDKGRIVDNGTVEWWGKQSQAAQDAAMIEEGRVSMEDAAAQISKFMVGVNKVWAQGPLFDIAMLEDFYAMVGKTVPWQFYNIRDSRTVFDMGDDSAKRGNGDAHNALADAFCQAQAVQQIYKQLGVVKKTK